MKKSAMISLVIVLVIILGGWYYLSRQTAPATDNSPSGAESSASSETGRLAAPLVTVVSDSVLGDYLVAANGMTLYKYANDVTQMSNCYDACAINWPPYDVEAGTPLAVGEGATGALAVVTRNDNSSQLSYNGVPLYFWKDDKKPGDTSGNNVGGVWFLVKP